MGDVGTAFSELGAGLSVNNCEVVAQMGDVPETIVLSPLDF